MYYGSDFAFSLVSLGRDHFEIAMRLAFDAHRKMSHYAIAPVTQNEYVSPRMILFWTDPKSLHDAPRLNSLVGQRDIEIQKLPYDMDVKAATEFVWNWLLSVEYPPEPITDGSNSKGFVISNYQRNEKYHYKEKIENNWYAAVQIIASWHTYSK